MHLIWCFIWLCLLSWIFVTPYDIPGQMKKKDTPLDILKNRFSLGQITKEQYEEHKAILENDLP